MTSTSCSVFSSHRDRRREPWATSWGRPMASSTWLGSRDPEVQAEPEEAQMPRSSLNALKAKADVARQPVVPVPVESAVGDGLQTGDELVPQGGDLGGMFR